MDIIYHQVVLFLRFVPAHTALNILAEDFHIFFAVVVILSWMALILFRMINSDLTR